MKRRIVILSASMGLIAVVVSLLFSAAITRPLRRLSRRMKQLGAGNYDAPVPSAGSYELFTVASAFDAMKTALDNARQQLLESEKRLRLTYHAAGLYAWEYDIATGRIRWLDASEEDERRHETSYRRFLKLVHHEDRRVVQDAMRRARNEGVYEAEYRILTPDRGLIWMSARGRRLAQEGSAPSEVMAGVAMDITLRKLGEEAIRNREKMEATAGMAASLAHEINNPLTAVTLALFMMNSRPIADDAAKQYLATAEQQAQRIGHITRRLLSLYRSGGEPEAVDVSTLVLFAVESVGADIAAKKVRITTSTGSGLTIVGYAGELRQALANILRNGVHASPLKGEMRLRARAAHDWKTGAAGVRITVADQGPGIPLGQQRTILQPFSTSEAGRRPGLGLWVSKAAVESHGGTLRLRTSTRPGQTGTVVSLFLPTTCNGGMKRPATSTAASTQRSVGMG